MRRFFKEIYSGVYPKGPNFWIYSTDFKPLLLTLIFQCEINPLFFLLRILNIFNAHTRGEGRKFFKETYSCVYPKGSISWIYSTGFKPLLLILIFQCEINPLFFLLKILSIFNTHTRGEGRRFFKETYSDVYPKKPNSFIYSTCFKPLLLILIFQCGINQLFFILRILNIFNTHTGRGEKVF